jgi:hypothetical protein
MTQQPYYVKVTTDQASARIGNDEWSQMAWFVKLANTTGFEIMTRGEQLIWEEEFVAMYVRGRGPVIDVPQDAKRYPRSPDTTAPEIVPHLPTPAQMQEVRDAIAPHIDNLADDKHTLLGGFTATLTIGFYKNADHDKNPNSPRFLTSRSEVSVEPKANSYYRTLELRMARLLEVHADKVRRCKLCRKFFLQFKRSAKYCSAKCYTVGCMRDFRAAQRTMPIKKGRKKGRVATPKRSSRHGTKRRH